MLKEGRIEHGTHYVDQKKKVADVGKSTHVAVFSRPPTMATCGVERVGMVMFLKGKGSPEALTGSLDNASRLASFGERRSEHWIHE